MVNKDCITYNYYYSKDDKNIYIPREVAELSPYLKEEIIKILKEDKLREINETIEIKIPDFDGETIELVIDYVNHKYYYEYCKKEQLLDVIKEEYKIEPEKALDVLKATVLLQC